MTKKKPSPRPLSAQRPLFAVPDDDPVDAPPDRRRVRAFAYGSNVDQDQMRHRCPSARLVGTATLRGHAMAFAGHSVSRGGPVATVFACKTLDVPGALYSITRDDLAALDRFEGVPWMYARTAAWVFTADGRKRRAEVYRLRDEHVRAGLGVPAPAYLGLIVTAYHQLGLPNDSLSVALTLAARVNERPRAKGPLTSRTPDPTYASRRHGRHGADDDE